MVAASPGVSQLSIFLSKVDFTEKTRSERLGAEILRILDTKALRQASNLELLR